jgi:hypothetical protein
MMISTRARTGATRIAVGVLVLLPTVALAQPSTDDIIVGYALLRTPGLGLPAQVYGVRDPSRYNLSARFGQANAPGGEALRSLALTLDGRPSRTARMGLTAARVQPSCDGCDAYVSVGLDGETHVAMDDGDGARSWELLFKPWLGYSAGGPDRNKALTIGASLPLLLTFGARWQVQPYVLPSFGYGQIIIDGRAGDGARLAFGGGVRLRSAARRIGVLAGVQHIVSDGVDPAFGGGLTWSWP